MKNQTFSEALERLQQNTVIVLNLSHQSLTARDAQQLAQALKTNTSLLGLNLSHNKIGYRGAQAIAEALKTNRTLQQIRIHHNQLSERDVTTLKHLWRLSDSRLTDMLQQLSLPEYQTPSTMPETMMSEDVLENKACDALMENQSIPVSANHHDDDNPPITLSQRVSLDDAPCNENIDISSPENNDLQAALIVSDNVNVQHASLNECTALNSSSTAALNTNRDAIDALIETLSVERDAYYQRMHRLLTPFVKWSEKDNIKQQKFIQSITDCLLWPLLMRKQEKIDALTHIQTLRRQAHLSVSEADNKVSRVALYRNALHRDFFGFQFFKQRTHDVIETMKHSEQVKP